MEQRYPELKIRVQSMAIDGVLMLSLVIAAAYVFDKTNSDGEQNDGLMRAIVLFVIYGIYEPLSMTLGCTLGNYLMKIRVRKEADNTKRINIFQAYVRFIVKLLLGWVSFLTIHSNDQRRAIHDFAGGSVMLEKQ